MSLPKVTVKLVERNPNFVARFVEGNNHAVNMDEYQAEYEIEVEIVQLNLNTGGMRVRYEWPNNHRKSGVEVVSRDIPISHFYDKYNIVEKT